MSLSTEKQEGLSNALALGVVVTGSTTEVFWTSMLILFDGTVSTMGVVVAAGADRTSAKMVVKVIKLGDAAGATWLSVERYEETNSGS